jgi:hypothetical protein
MNKTTNFLLAVILVAVLINLALTTIMLGRQTAAESVDRLDRDIATAWGDRVVELYNRQDHAALHALFSPEARIKIGEQQLAGQLSKLHELFGDIDDFAYVNSVRLGEKGGASYYQVFFDARVSARESPATLKLSLVVKDEIVSLYGMRINASESLD